MTLATSEAPSTGPGDVQLHLSLLNDRARTSGFLAAIDRVVRPGDVVVDIGTGTGILALRAAQAGARVVYAVEMGAMAGWAERLVAANGMGERVKVVRGRSYDVELPERADVLIAELIGHSPLAEGVIGVTADAVERLLKPGARLVPDGVKLYGVPVSIPDDAYRGLCLRTATLDTWGEWYGLDFSVLGGAAHDAVHYLDPHQLRDWPALSPPVLLGSVDLRSWRTLWLRASRTVTATASGALDGMVVYFELTSAAAPFLSTSPAVVDGAKHWLSPVAVFARSRPVVAGQTLELSYWSLVSGVSGCGARTVTP